MKGRCCGDDNGAGDSNSVVMVVLMVVIGVLILKGGCGKVEGR